MIYQYSKRYLKEKYDEPIADFQWKNIDNLNFLSHIRLRYSDEQLHKEIREVKEAFKDFFEPVGTVLFRYTEEYGVRFKVFPYRVNPQESEHLEEIVKLIKKNRKYVQVCYDGQENQVAILGKIRREINALMFDSQESINKRELTKYAIRKSLNLDEKDVIVQLKRIYIVKIFDENTQPEEIEEPLVSQEAQKSHNGYSKENIKKSYNEIFNKADIEEFIQSILLKAFQTKLDFSNISHDYYEKKSLKIIHAQIAKDLSFYSALESDYLAGLASYILREQLYNIHKIMAMKLFEEIYNKNQNATDFILKFNGTIILYGGNKYKLPTLQDANSKPLSSTIITSTAFLYVKIKKKIEELQELIKTLDIKIVTLKFSLDNIDNNDTHKIQGTNQQIESLETRIKSVKYDISCYEKDIHTKQTQIDTVSQAITVALMSRKKLIGTQNV